MTLKEYSFYITKWMLCCIANKALKSATQEKHNSSHTAQYIKNIILLLNEGYAIIPYCFKVIFSPNHYKL